MSTTRHADIGALGVYQVYTGTGTGTGFLIDERHLITNAHVVAPCRQVAVEMRDRSRILGTVRCVHPRRDLAVVELERSADGEVLGLSDAPLKARQLLHILGFPVGLPLALTEGVVSHPRQLMDQQHFVQTDAAINPGNSGGPMLDDAQRIVAVTTCKLDAADSVGFGIPVADLHAFIEGFRAQSAEFGVHCTSCDELIVQETRYCPGCGHRLDKDEEFVGYFDEDDAHPVSSFVEQALAGAGVNPVLARHGELHWSFYKGSVPIRLWSCCPDHLNLASSLVQPGKRRLRELFGFLMSDAHAPYTFDLCNGTVRMSLFVHVADIFASDGHAVLMTRMVEFIDKVDDMAAHLASEYGCLPAKEREDAIEAQ